MSNSATDTTRKDWPKRNVSWLLIALGIAVLISYSYKVNLIHSPDFPFHIFIFIGYLVLTMFKKLIGKILAFVSLILFVSIFCPKPLCNLYLGLAIVIFGVSMKSVDAGDMID